ncbi:TetR/AcrR family transcriptional regulator [Variovorax sp. UC122_21]|uniref:TetR/AcrR family transcriptional regulator n=1 Tax=Variovorax sp. UC122_21 TaxID=3374554 RepID=UPI0037574A9E
MLDGAIAFFSERGLDGQTRELAQQIGITHPLLYHYFPNKRALIERVYEEVYLERWQQEWEEWLSDRSTPLEARLACASTAPMRARSSPRSGCASWCSRGCPTVTCRDSTWNCSRSGCSRTSGARCATSSASRGAPGPPSASAS